MAEWPHDPAPQPKCCHRDRLEAGRLAESVDRAKQIQELPPDGGIRLETDTLEFGDQVLDRSMAGDAEQIRF